MTNIEKAYSLYDSERREDAFTMFKEIALNEDNTPEDRSDAYNMLGLIGGGINKGLLNEESEEFDFFKKAMDLDSNNFIPALNLIFGYGIGYNFHANHEYFIGAYNMINNHFLDQLSIDEIDEMQKRKKLYDELNNKNS